MNQFRTQTMNELYVSSGTNYNVVKKPLISDDGWRTDSYGLFREDNGTFFAAVKDRYTVMQNYDLLSLLYQAAESVGVNISRGGTLSGGKKVYYQLDLETKQIGGSQMLRYLTALNSHDGQTPIGFGTTNIVVVCRNTFFKAFQDLEKVRHTQKAADRIGEMVKVLQTGLLQENLLIEQFEQMSGTSIPERVDDDFLRAILGVEDNTRANNRLAKLKEAIVQDVQIHGNTQWGLFNGVTRFTNYYDPQKDLRRSLIEGSGYKINNRALELIPTL